MTSGTVLSMGRSAAPSRAVRRSLRATGNPAGGIDSTTPSAARMYDHYLGGKDNYAVDRALAERALRRAPIISRLVRVNRAFLGDSVRLLAQQAGIRQFLDIGCGLPTHDNVDDIVRRVDPACRVAYVDNDPMVFSHARALLAVSGDTKAFAADLREPGEILGHPELTQLIDFSEPVAVLLLSVLHFISDAENPRRIIDDLLSGLPPGSHVVISHAERTPDLEAVSALYQEADVPFTPRSRQEIAGLSHGLELFPPYPVNLPLSRFGHQLRIRGTVPLIGCIGRKPA
ncbi:SAM-dependent methyltransferase [Actinomadura alba]|uniref:SAM-dependent methyltransferase n=1 Tax=Actinomadura alba TaxID=406431 RepID=A0ABR7LU34_9ACTN|nr:SAM-dependent methyltransferase [Actinomadura alba]MBC6467923.1 SAM-dependent methyltransferase [Actinomadura alba]